MVIVLDFGTEGLDFEIMKVPLLFVMEGILNSAAAFFQQKVWFKNEWQAYTPSTRPSLRKRAKNGRLIDYLLRR